MADNTDLTPEQQARLRGVSAEMQVDKITVSFSIEGRCADGTKRSAFSSLSTSRVSEESSEVGWTAGDAKIARLLLCKQVVQATYEDALRRGILSKDSVVTELPAVMHMYDRALQRALVGGNDGSQENR